MNGKPKLLQQAAGRSSAERVYNVDDAWTVRKVIHSLMRPNLAALTVKDQLPSVTASGEPKARGIGHAQKPSASRYDHICLLGAEVTLFHPRNVAYRDIQCAAAVHDLPLTSPRAKVLVFSTVNESFIELLGIARPSQASLRRSHFCSVISAERRALRLEVSRICNYSMGRRRHLPSLRSSHHTFRSIWAIAPRL